LKKEITKLKKSIAEYEVYIQQKVTEQATLKTDYQTMLDRFRALKDAEAAEKQSEVAAPGAGKE